MYPLHSIRVLDFSIMYAGPGSAVYLGDMGAEVIKIESPRGDDSRGLGRLTANSFAGTEARAFQAVNRNKRGIIIDLAKPEGQEIARRLARDADVLVHNFRQGVAERIGIDYPTMSEVNPRLIYARVTAWGSRGPAAARPGYDSVIQGYSGVQHQRGLRDGQPSGAGFFFADTSVPMLLSYAVGAALFARERTGRGQYVEASLLGLGIAMQSLPWVRIEGEEQQDADSLLDDVIDRVCPVLRCGDGASLCAGVVQDEEWQALCRVTGQAALAGDPRFATLEARNLHADALREELMPVFAARSREAWMRALKEGGVPCTPVHTRDEALAEPQIVGNNIVAHLPHPTVGRTRVYNIPARLWDTPGAVRRPAPTFGQHTDAILRESGYADAEIAALRERGAVQ